jgi:hypothetical protein
LLGGTWEGKNAHNTTNTAVSAAVTYVIFSGPAALVIVPVTNGKIAKGGFETR